MTDKELQRVTNSVAYIDQLAAPIPFPVVTTTDERQFGVMTCGLRNLVNPTSDNLSPQETTTQGTADVAEDGARLSCPGSSEI